MYRLVKSIVYCLMIADVASYGIISRRQVLERVASTSATVAFVMASPAGAAIIDETPLTTTRMGGLLEKYQDSNRGWTILAPSGWNKFDGEVGAYDVKWQDLVDPRDNIKVSSTPVKSTTTSMYVFAE
jgi:PsbP